MPHARLADTQILAQLSQLQGWKLSSYSPLAVDGSMLHHCALAAPPTLNALVAEFEWGTFVRAWHFLQRVADLAEAENHHPDIFCRYGYVRLCLTTHDSGGITALDIKMATAINAMAIDNGKR